MAESTGFIYTAQGPRGDEPKAPSRCPLAYSSNTKLSLAFGLTGQTRFTPVVPLKPTLAVLVFHKVRQRETL